MVYLLEVAVTDEYDGQATGDSVRGAPRSGGVATLERDVKAVRFWAAAESLYDQAPPE